MNKIKKKILWGGLISLFSVLIGICCYNSNIRTKLFRSIAKGNWYLLCDDDTLYTFGYYGMKKYLTLEDGNLVLLKENSKYTVGTMIYRGGCFHEKYIYVTLRSWLPGSVDESQNGGILVVEKQNLKIVRHIDSDIKLVEAHTCDNNLIVSGIGGFDIFDITNPDKPMRTYSYRRKDHREYQGFDIMQRDSCVYAAFSLFGEGMELWDITRSKSPILIEEVKLPIKGQSMDLICLYPYIYATLGPLREDFDCKNNIRGILVYDISCLSNIKTSMVRIPKKDWYNRKTGDCQPTYIALFGNKLYVNFSEKGVAKFDITDPAKPKYIDLLDFKHNLIQPIAISNNGSVYAGSYYWSSVYCLK